MTARQRPLLDLGLQVGLTLLLGALNAVFPISAAAGVLHAAPSMSGSGDCSAWAEACTLRAALTSAVGADQIWVKAGVHVPGANRTDAFVLKSGVAVYGGFNGTETVLAQRDPAANPTILSGDIDGNDVNSDANFVAETTADIAGANSYHVLVGGGTDATAILDGFVVTAGQGNGTWPNNGGGGMDIRSGNPTLTNVRFSGNLGVDGGGGMYLYLSSPTLTAVTFTGNAARDGAGMYIETGSPTLAGATFTGNSASGSGGGIYTYRSGNAALGDAVFTANTAFSRGGGMFNDSTSSPGLARVRFFGNSAANGGGMMNFDRSNPTLVSVSFTGNTASVDGGGLLNDWSSPALTNVTFTGNTATGSGGGLRNQSGSSPTVTNGILWGNVAADGSQLHNADGASMPTLSHADIQGCGGSGAGWDASLGADGGGNTEADPVFVDADGADDVFGTADDNPRLQGGSPAVNAGDGVALPPGSAIDLGGMPRVSGGRVDMGAYEYQFVTAIFRSQGALDGSILETDETSNAGGTRSAAGSTLSVGDDALDRQYRAVLSFNTSTLPDTAVISRVTLALKPVGASGTSPFLTHGNLVIDFRKGPLGDSAALQSLDFQAAASKAGTGVLPKTATGGWHARTWTSVVPGLVNKTGPTQVRLRFAKDDNDDRNADFFRFASGDAAASSRPQLVVEYSVP